MCCIIHLTDVYTIYTSRWLFWSIHRHQWDRVFLWLKRNYINFFRYGIENPLPKPLVIVTYVCTKKPRDYYNLLNSEFTMWERSGLLRMRFSWKNILCPLHAYRDLCSSVTSDIFVTISWCHFYQYFKIHTRIFIFMFRNKSSTNESSIWFILTRVRLDGEVVLLIAQNRWHFDVDWFCMCM